MKTINIKFVVSLWLFTTVCFLIETTVVMAQTSVRRVPTHTNQAYSHHAPPPPPSEFLINCSGAPDPGNTLSTSNPVCANVEFTLSLQNSGGSGVNYQWQSNTGAGFADIPGATDATLTTTEAVGTNYQCIVTCTNSGLFTASSNLLVAVSNSSGCPLTVTPGGTATQIAQTLLGPGVTVSNATMNCTSNAYGIFTGGLAHLGLNEGIVLTSGSAVDLIGPNNSWFQSTPNYTPGDTDLSVLSGNPTFDECWISFDFIPTCDTVAFDYVFGSEEYPEYVNSPFNDVFAFFISGPGIIGTQNIALVPGANIPIAINNVNDGFFDSCAAILPGPCTNCQYYVNNCEGNAVQYDGYTTALAASAAVTVGQTYHLKLSIADASDYVYDSGVMLESKSLSCVSTAVLEDAIRGCQDGDVRFCRSGSTAEAHTVHFTIGGTAVMGVDYYPIADSVVIPAGQQCTIFDIFPTDVATGTIKTVVLTTTDFNVLTVNILDGVSVTTSVEVEGVCGYSTIEASGAETYTWSPADGLTATTGETVIASPSVTTTYTVVGRITQSGCSDTTTVTVNAGQPLSIYYRDADGDGYGNANVSVYYCQVPAGYVTNSTDCNDANSSVHPGATEVCGNNIDDNCNGQVDENCGGSCAVPTGLTVVKITATSAKLKWNEVEGAEGYKVRYKVIGTNEWNHPVTSNPSKPLSNLLPNTTYKWKVKTYCTIEPNLMSDWSAEQTFTTGSLKSDASSREVIFEVYPNPFSSSASILFSVWQDSRVQIELYDLTGRKLQTVLDENVAAGNQEVNLNRNQLHSGIYLIKLSINSDVMMKKVVIE
ncbi:MAG TPA: choice-of-anchor L domain-containing protein [Chitinophagales bacterium]|nr:choice-of-anchor L domain-containing protein [Chitinophagales bacterium]